MNLTIDNLSKSYGKIKALQGFSAEFDSGIYALLGPNGSGKSTLMNIITDNLTADEGLICFDCENVLDMGVRFREKLGFMPQYPGLYPNFTVEGLLHYIAALKNIGADLKGKEQKAFIAEKIAEVLKAVELDDIAARKIGTLSGGMKQRLALAVAVLGDPSVLILDEPTAGLDPKQRIAIRNFISKIALDKIVIIATHVVSDIEFIARDVIMLKKGVIVDNAPPYELTKKIEGKVWSVPCAEDRLTEMQSSFSVISLARDDEGGEVILRVLADEKPTERAENVTPTLEDYYLYVFGEASSEG